MTETAPASGQKPPPRHIRVTPSGVEVEGQKVPGVSKANVEATAGEAHVVLHMGTRGKGECVFEGEAQVYRSAWEDPVAHPLEEYHEDYGPVLWWHPDEAPWCGTPLDSDWPGYHRWWTRLPAPPLNVYPETFIYPRTPSDSENESQEGGPHG